MGIVEILQTLSVVAAAGGVFYAALTFVRTQQWQRLRFASEAIDKIYRDDTLRLANKFIDWHDREILLPDIYSQYGSSNGIFHHKLTNMTIALSVESREFDEETGIYDLKSEYRTPQYIIYVEVFDQFFDYISQINTFIHAGLIKDSDVTPLVYILRRLDALKIFHGYLEKYEVDDVLEIIHRFRKPTYVWARG